MGEAKTPAELVREVRSMLQPGCYFGDAVHDLSALCDALEAAQSELQQLRAEREGDPVRKLVTHPRFVDLWFDRTTRKYIATIRCTKPEHDGDCHQGCGEFDTADAACAVALQALVSGEGRDGET